MLEYVKSLTYGGDVLMDDDSGDWRNMYIIWLSFKKNGSQNIGYYMRA